MKIKSKKIIFPLTLILYTLFFIPMLADASTFWSVQSIDTVKYSRDLAREKLRDQSFNSVINAQVANIAKTGATHIAIGTPYDSEFLPYLQRWVSAARKNNLKVWFRGNWSGWEGWFGYSKIDRQQHMAKTYDFIVLNKNLFEDGDVFTACPECENGGPGDPRSNNDLNGHRQFLINEHKTMANAFKRINKNVIFNFNSMNGDVAKLVMDKKTTQALGGVITIDHYVKTKERLISDIKKLSEQGGGAKIVLGEFGAPIPDIHGKMSAIDQAKWVQDALFELAKTDKVTAINYWTGVGSSTELWDSKLTARPVAKVMKDFYQPSYITGYVKNELDRPVEGAVVLNEYASVITGADGLFRLPYVSYIDPSIKIEKDGFVTVEKVVKDYDGKSVEIILNQIQKSFGFKLLKVMRQLGSILLSIFD